jgi:hypothetical protein
MPTPSIRLDDGLYRPAKSSDHSMSQLARRGIEEGIMAELDGVCWFCGRAIHENERRERHQVHSDVSGERQRLTVLICMACDEQVSTATQHGASERPPESYMYELLPENRYELGGGTFPAPEIMHITESVAVANASVTGHRLRDSSNYDYPGFYWAARDRSGSILDTGSIPWVEIALRSHAYSLAWAGSRLVRYPREQHTKLHVDENWYGDRRTLPIFQWALLKTASVADRAASGGPHQLGFDIMQVFEYYRTRGSTQAASETSPPPGLHLFESRCGACGALAPRGEDECEVCFHSWYSCQGCESGHVEPKLVPDAPAGEWLGMECYHCGENYGVADAETHEAFAERYSRVFNDLEDELPDLGLPFTDD